MTPFLILNRGCVVVLLISASFAGQTAQQTAWSLLRTGTASKSTQDRSGAVRVLGLIARNRQAKAMAIEALKDPKPEVRAAAAIALGGIGFPSGIPKLKSALDDKDIRVAIAAGHGLLQLKDKSGYEVFYAVLTGERKGGTGLISGGMETLKDPKKLAALGFNEGVGFIPFVGTGYSAIKAIKKDDASPVRAAAAKILENDPDPASAQALIKALSDDKWLVRAAALEAIARRNDPTLLKEIELGLEDDNRLVQYTAAAAVLRLSSSGIKLRTTAPRTKRSLRQR